MNIEIITITNKEPEQDYYCWHEFHKSLERHWFAPKVLGFGQPWGGLMTKPRRLREHLRKGLVKADCLIVCDSWDLVFADSPQVIAEKWDAMGRAWVCGSERNCFPDASLESKHPKCASSYRFLNSGFIVSTQDDMLKVLEHMNLDSIPDDGQDEKNPCPCDQHYYMMEFLNQKIPMYLDTETKFVWNLCGVDSSNFSFEDGGRIINRETNNAPSVFHFNGGSKTDGMMDKILSQLKLR